MARRPALSPQPTLSRRPTLGPRLIGGAIVVLAATLSLLAAAPTAGANAGAHATGHWSHHSAHHRRGAHPRHRHHHRHHRRSHRRHHVRTPSRLLAAPLSAPSAPCANVDTPATAAPPSVLDAAVVCLINQERTSRGLPALLVNSKLASSAQSWTDWMVANGQFTHGSDFAGRISATGYNWQTAGENIATGYDTPRQVVAAWMASPDHCRNILDPSFRDVGTGVVAAPVSGWASGPATWTQDFGLSMYAVAPSANSGPQSGCPYSS